MCIYKFCRSCLLVVSQTTFVTTCKYTLNKLRSGPFSWHILFPSNSIAINTIICIARKMTLERQWDLWKHLIGIWDRPIWDSHYGMQAASLLEKKAETSQIYKMCYSHVDIMDFHLLQLEPLVTLCLRVHHHTVDSLTFHETAFHGLQYSHLSRGRNWYLWHSTFWLDFICNWNFMIRLKLDF